DALAQPITRFVRVIPGRNGHRSLHLSKMPEDPFRRCAKITSATPSGMIKNACFSRVLSVIAPAPLLKLFLRTALAALDFAVLLQLEPLLNILDFAPGDGLAGAGEPSILTDRLQRAAFLCQLDHEFGNVLIVTDSQMSE